MDGLTHRAGNSGGAYDGSASSSGKSSTKHDVSKCKKVGKRRVEKTHRVDFISRPPPLLRRQRLSVTHTERCGIQTPILGMGGFERCLEPRGSYDPHETRGKLHVTRRDVEAVHKSM